MLKEKYISRRAFVGLLQMLKPKSFPGRCPLDPRRGSAPGPHAVRRSARFAFMDSKLFALTRRTNTRFIPTGLLEDLHIEIGPFTQEEYQEAQSSLVEGKSCGEDCIPPEVLKRCNLDDIILKFCNQTLLHGKKPEQWSILTHCPNTKSRGP